MATQPNFVVVFTDQCRYDVLSCNASRPGGDTAAVCRTPNLEAMAERGVVFDNAFSCCGICSPARASLLTGRYPHNHGVLNNTHDQDTVRPDLPEGEVSLVSCLRDAGYRTVHLGKWHASLNRGPSEFGFTDVTGMDWWEFLQSIDAPHPPPRNLTWVPYPTPGTHGVPMYSDAPAEEHVPEYFFFREAGRALEECAASPNPFFLIVNTNGPHFPCTPPPEFNTYDPKAIPPWPNFEETFEGKPAGHLRLARQRGCIDLPWEEWAEYVARYFGMVSYIDHLMGGLFDGLERLGLRENTYVVFMTDHGDLSGSHRIFNKGRIMYEELYHIPLLVEGPGIEGGRRRDGFVNTVDIMPTILQLAGAAPPDVSGREDDPAWQTDRRPGLLDGQSFAGELTGTGKGQLRDYAAAEYHGEEFGLHSQRMIRSARYKYVYNPADLDELYDLAADPAELSNRISDPTLAGVLAEHRAMLEEWMEGTRDTMYRWVQRGLL